MIRENGAAHTRDSVSHPALIAVVDTEEEFDWSLPFDRASIGVGHMRHIGRIQAIFEAWGVRPVYVVNYPIVTQEPGIGALAPLLREGRALVGAHLHPWVSPPHEEEVCRRNSFPGNLSPALEYAKLRILLEHIDASFGTRAVIYKAGRYGIGPNTFAILEELGFTIDLSPAPPFDYSAEDGPNFSRRGLAPAWVGPRRTVLSIPSTGALIGFLPDARLYRVATARPLRPLRLPGILARLGMIERLNLSPEGHDTSELARLTRWLHERGERLFVLGLHSPSIEPGHTPYVRTEQDLAFLLKTLDGFLRFFITELKGVPTDPLAIRDVFPRPLTA